MTKSEVFFCHNTPPNLQIELSQVLGIPHHPKPSKYLGLPSWFGRSKGEMFRFLSEKVDQKLQGWKQQLLPQAGKEILMKSVVAATPIYAMSSFLLPKSLCSSIDKKQKAFRWGQKAAECRIHWVG